MLRIAYQSFSLDLVSRGVGALILSLSIFVGIMSVTAGQCRGGHCDPSLYLYFIQHAHYLRHANDLVGPSSAPVWSSAPNLQSGCRSGSSCSGPPRWSRLRRREFLPVRSSPISIGSSHRILKRSRHLAARGRLAASSWRLPSGCQKVEGGYPSTRRPWFEILVESVARHCWRMDG